MLAEINKNIYNFLLEIGNKPLIIFFIPFLIYMMNMREISNSDPIANAMVAIHVSAYGSTYLNNLDKFVEYNEIPYYATKRNDNILSNYPILPGMMAAPLFATAYYAGMIKEDGGDLTWRYMMKFSGAIFTSIAIVFLYYTLCFLVSSPAAILLAYTCALGTAFWPIASQSLWHHSASLVWISIFLYSLIRLFHGQSNQKHSHFFWYSVLCGIACGAAIWSRYSNVMIVFIICFMCFLLNKKYSAIITSISALAIGLLLVHNYSLFGTFNGGYNELYQYREAFDNISSGTWSTPIMEGLYGQLLSPSRGLLIFSPFFIFTILGIVSISLNQSHRILLILILPIIVQLLVYSKYAVWWGGTAQYGPRYLIEIYPFMMVLIAYAWNKICNNRVLLALFITMVCYSVMVQSLGAFCYPSDWAIKPTELNEDYSRLWDWSYNQITECFKKCFN